MSAMELREFLKDLVVDRSVIDTFLDIHQPNWAVFDPTLGYRLRSSRVRDGVDDSWTLSTYQSFGERRMVNYAGRRCRISTYGDSFTQCHQVSDGETWQEYLAAHFGEPVRNFGIGGYGVYQALLRMRTHEADPETAGEYVILNIFDDDHYRNIDRWRWIRISGFREEVRGTNPFYFHANPWSHVRIDPMTGQFTERPSLCPTPESLYGLCDVDFISESFQDDFVVHCELAKAGGSYDPKVLRATADLLGVSIDLRDPDKAAEAAEALHTRYALRSSEYVVSLARAFCEERGKKLMVVQSFGAGNIDRAIKSQERFDADFTSWLEQSGLPRFDLFDAHAEDYRQFNLSPPEYLKRYFIWGFGHYNPTGNHFFAFALKSRLLNWLDPKPMTYLDGGIASAGMANLLA